VYIGLGSTIEPKRYPPRAVQLLRQRSRVTAVSSAWISPPIGNEGPNFLNAAAKLLTQIQSTS